MTLKMIADFTAVQCWMLGGGSVSMIHSRNLRFALLAGFDGVQLEVSVRHTTSSGGCDTLPVNTVCRNEYYCNH